MEEGKDPQQELASYYATNPAIGALIYRAQKLGPAQLRRDSRKLQAWELEQLHTALIKLNLDDKFEVFLASPDLDDSYNNPIREGN